MIRLTRLFGISIAVSLLLMTGIVCLAAPQRQPALASVAVARAAMDIANEKPSLPDSSGNRFRSMTDDGGRFPTELNVNTEVASHQQQPVGGNARTVEIP